MGSLPVQDRKANVLVIGSGGVGTMAAYALEKGGKAEVTAVLRSNFEAVEESGFDIKSIDHGPDPILGWRPTYIRNTIPNVEKEARCSGGVSQPYDFIVVTTKNLADIPPSVASLIAPAVTPGRTSIALLQNGLNIEQPIIKAFPHSPVISGVPYIGAIENPPGTITHVNHDKLVISPFYNENISRERSENAAKELQQAYGLCTSVTCVYESRVEEARWRKLLYNASYNTTAAILGMDTSRMRASEFIIDDLVRPAMKEIQATAHAVSGVNLSDDMIEAIIRADNYKAFFRPSMLQDMVKGKFIELENILGEPLREAERAGVYTPTLKVIYSLLKGLQFKTKESKGLVKVPASGEGLKYGKKWGE
ncbi:putative 2-dehydropantoate 2-reductase [Triangularia setosa]|uniref:2-dehydropantoate 2-reductase n=1 Tax=Triangularia setosa TaxID=2587417 RepID=A0AAN6W7S1_9PEZI|nr:putative 2-dehydropantoate 2-reductase [Podospora setosa]